MAYSCKKFLIDKKKFKKKLYLWIFLHIIGLFIDVG